MTSQVQVSSEAQGYVFVRVASSKSHITSSKVHELHDSLRKQSSSDSYGANIGFEGYSLGGEYSTSNESENRDIRDTSVDVQTLWSDFIADGFLRIAPGQTMNFAVQRSESLWFVSVINSAAENIAENWTTSSLTIKVTDERVEDVIDLLYVQNDIDWTWVWSDQGTGARTDCSIWRPRYTGSRRGYIAIGYYATRNYDHPSGAIIVPETILYTSTENAWIANDKGTGGKHDVSHWLNTDSGSICSIAVNHYDNYTNRSYCLPSHYVREKEFQEIWNDKGTGGNHDHSLCVDEFDLLRAHSSYGSFWATGISSTSVIRE